MNLLIHGLLLTISSSLYAALSKIIIVVYYNIITWQEMSGSNDTRFSIVNVGSRYIYNHGTEFVANINDVKVGKPIKTVNGNVELGTANGGLNEKWYFTRQSDGSYFIKSLADNNYITVSGGSSNNGTNIVTSKYTGGNEQRWFAYPYNNKFELVPKCAMSSRMNLAGGSTNDKTNIALWQEMYGSNDNLFNISNKAALNTIKFTISYNMNGGSGSISNQTKTYGQDLTLSSTKPTRTGYDFVGWNTNASATTVQYQPGGKYTANSGATLYAIWKINTWTVSYNMNGGSGSISNQTKTYGQDLTLNSTKPTRTGYTFVGWNTSASATTAQYQPGGKYTANSGATLYAIWKINTWTVSYNMNGGSGSISNQTKTYGQDLTLSSTKPTRTGYTFVGWNTSASATTAQYQPGGKYTANSGATLYAIWKINTWTVSYNMNGGSGSISNQTKNYGQDLTLSSTKPTRTGYDFVGWNTSANATTAQYQPGGKYTANSGATLYAIWKAKQITVTFYRNQNSSDNTTATQTFTYGASGQSFSNKNWTKDGYTLLGWSFDRNATTAT